MPHSIIDPNAIHPAIADVYWNQQLTPINDHEIRMSVMTHPFGWHRHPDSDETFLVLDGELIISFKDAEVVLKPGQILTVPAGVVHKTRPNGYRSVNLTFERRDAATEFLPDQDLQEIGPL